MIVSRHINVALQTFRAWQHRMVVDSVVKPSDIQNAYTAQWEDPDRSFVPVKITDTSGLAASSVTANVAQRGLL